MIDPVKLLMFAQSSESPLIIDYEDDMWRRDDDETALSCDDIVVSRSSYTAALGELISARKVVEAARKRLGYCDCDWESVGHTGACLALSVALAEYDKAVGK